MRLFQAALDTCLDSPFFAGLSVHSLHFTVYAPSICLEILPELRFRAFAHCQVLGLPQIRSVGLSKSKDIRGKKAFFWVFLQVKRSDPEKDNRHIRNYYLSNSKTFQDGNGNGNPGKLIRMTCKMVIENRWK